MLRLALQGYDGPDWREFARALAEYGFVVLRSWIRLGKIFEQCAAKRFAVSNAGIQIGCDDAVELSCETVAIAIKSFRERILIPGKWDPTRKASLKTYFVGHCVLQFPNVYRRWVTEHCTPPANLHPQAVEVAVVRPASPDQQAELHRQGERLPRDDARRIRALNEGAGYSLAEIAQDLGKTVRALENKLYRARHPQRRTER